MNIHIKKIIAPIIGLLYPKRCVACDKVLLKIEKEVGFCRHCQPKIGIPPTLLAPSQFAPHNGVNQRSDGLVVGTFAKADQGKVEPVSLAVRVVDIGSRKGSVNVVSAQN